MSTLEDARHRMVRQQLRGRGIEDRRVLAAMDEVPREWYMPFQLRDHAYDDMALPIPDEQTISQPWIVARILEALELNGSELVLEVGTGWGYSAAVLSKLARRVVSVERHEGLARSAQSLMSLFDIDNVDIVVGDGSLGLPERAPFDAIACHATAPTAPPALLDQLAEGGRLVVPLDGGDADVLTLYRRVDDRFESEPLTLCRFVPLIGAGGFEAG